MINVKFTFSGGYPKEIIGISKLRSLHAEVSK